MKAFEFVAIAVVALVVGALLFVVGRVLLTDEENLGREEIDGVECIVARNGFGRVRAISCDWGPG